MLRICYWCAMLQLSTCYQCTINLLLLSMHSQSLLLMRSIYSHRVLDLLYINTLLTCYQLRIILLLCYDHPAICCKHAIDTLPQSNQITIVML